MKVVKILSYVWQIQSKQIVKGKSIVSIIGSLLFLAIMALYGVGVGMMFQYSERFHFAPSELLFFINTAILGMTLIKSYFPSYKPLANPLPSFFPVSRIERAFVSVILDIISPYSIAIAVFYGIVFSIGFEYIAMTQMLITVIIFFSISLADRSLKCLFEYNVPFRWLHLAIVTLNIIGFFLKPNLFANHHLFVTGVCLASLGQQCLLAFFVILPQTGIIRNAPLKHLATNDSRTKTTYIVKTFLRTRSVLIVLALGLLVQILPLTFVATRNPEQLRRMISDFHFNIVLGFVAPIACFTYILNNAFGLNWYLWQTVHLHNGTRISTAFLYLRLALTILTIDLIMLLPALWYRQILTIENLGFWFLSAVTMIFIGFVLATTQAMKIEKISMNMMTSIRSFSSPISSIITLVIVSILIFSYSFYYALSIGIAIIGAVAALFISFSDKTLKHKIYHAIHS
ncbi:MAG: hypothetical protein MUF71_10795 [Candidatus Kapabacteria bacterium]|jgi:hypothetical protein|nr:hypothetical protein [Candidatus Kapabacteria bacterium]